jgi:hypothetical protein
MLNTARVPSTFGATVMFGIAVAASYGTAALFSQIGSRMSLSKWALPFLLLGIGFEFLVMWPFPISSAEVPSAIQWIAAQPGRGAILHLGMDQEQFDDRVLYYQTVTRRPLVGGETQSATSKGSPWSQMLFGLIQVDPGTSDVVPRPQKAERARWLRHFDVDYVVTHRSENGLVSPYGAIAEALLEPPAYADPHMAVFAVPGDALSPEGSYLYTFSSQGWRPPRHEERWLRWMNEEDGLLYLYSTREGTGGLRFAVDALSQLNLPTLRVSLNNERVDEFLVDDRTTYTTRLVTIREGMNVFHFHTSAECEDVEDSSSPCRLLVLDQVSFVARDGLSDRELSQVDFGNQLELRGWKLENTAVHPGDSLTVTLTWQSKVKLGRSHVVFVHLLSEDGELVAQRDLAPVGDVVSPSTWPEGATLALPMTIELPFDLPPGEYRLRTGVYLWPDLERLPVSDDVPGSQNNVAEIGTVRAVSR